MPKLCAPMRLSPALALMLAGPALAGTALMTAVPAQAQFYVRPFGGVYVERYYEPLPALPPGGYYAPPPVYRAPGRFPYADIQPMLRSMGMSAIGRARVDGDTYVVDATDRGGMRMRVRIDAFNGRVLAMHPIGQAPVARQSVPPAMAPLPPKKPPELAAVTAPAPPPVAAPQGAAPPVTAPVTAPDGSNAAVPAERRSEVPPATEPTESANADPAVRVIPGIAVPPGTEPQQSPEEAASKPTDETPSDEAPAPAAEAAPADEPADTGTGVGTGSDTPAGTASVMARGTKPAPQE
ncbi:hypothetical protein Snov_2712 [Ancylobacter novellus DSM 506]|uniref:PepSY domain-containing protein n=1 Tax=Ancylobacter novellus (strain ATCC 8093 / DSM 506 / JCM 20403 / CCM 1077 / IAM 12100 / NBRC 12443 / NCIMB 10456) TaxID=639283 RepID=D7A5B3_ANCN5|nr:hypothetical protein [Ancylobacter novellus]ADH90001.1 hypothetical protein Snov_2712 [Ancylobacter novellus DSM 506]